ncbi:MAG: cell division protein SepF [Clostridiaceae bacterium]|jgi:cell division inhibitor SepF|nr:cell division protein SepF [Clostridiaceae bacterium]
MAKILNKMLDFVGWETQDYQDEPFDEDEMDEDIRSESHGAVASSKKSHGKVLNLNSSATTKVVIVSPRNINDAKDICDHLRSNRSIVMNVEDIETQIAQRIVDFLSGAVYSLDGNIQKVSSGIFLATPNSVDILGEIKEDLHNKGIFPWAK